MAGTPILKAKSITEIKGKFVIESYQRGYRWNEEVKKLLDDIYKINDIEDNNKSKPKNIYFSQPILLQREGEGFTITPYNEIFAKEEERNTTSKYCLQPIVVKNIGDNRFELIDGQQRLTTLYLIMKVINELKQSNVFSIRYEIDYKTRSESKKFLENPSKEEAEKNIDFHYIYNSYHLIKEYFIKGRFGRRRKNGERRIELKEDLIDKIKINLENNVEVIRYEVDSSADSNELFQRLNIGKIPLTNSELVKALFLNEASKKELGLKERTKISIQWDNIEKDLHDDSFWYFLTNYDNTSYQTRMDLILKLKSESKNKREIYSSFFYFEEKRNKNESLVEIWNEIEDTYLTLKGWYKDHELYHLIGYLVSSGFKGIEDIYDEYIKKLKQEKDFTRSRFKKRLKELIIESVKLYDEKNYIGLSYLERKDNELIWKVLLLFNVISVLEHNDKLDRFPFDRFKKDNNEQNKNWSLEHIDAQHSVDLDNKNDWLRWIREHIDFVKKVKNSKEFAEKSKDNEVVDIDKLLNDMETATDKINGEIFDSIKERTIKVLTKNEDEKYTHNIANLALLEKSDNSTLSNSLFGAKRKKIIELDKEGHFIPFCTKMVFLKYYSDNLDDQIIFWSNLDRENYVKEMNRVLYDGGYIKESISLEEED